MFFLIKRPPYANFSVYLSIHGSDVGDLLAEHMPWVIHWLMKLAPVGQNWNEVGSDNIQHRDSVVCLPLKTILAQLSL